MRSALTFLLLAAFSLLPCAASLAQQIDPQSGFVCEPKPADMNAVRERAQAGDAMAEYELGRSMLSINPTVPELERAFATAVPWIRRSAEQGYAPAEYLYGYMSTEGRWRNLQQVRYWWTEAAEHGQVQAQLWLGLYYEQGVEGFERDYAQALKWLSMAAKQGQPDAQVALGQMYENGAGLPKDYAWAAYWYRKAADHVMDFGGAGQGASRLAELYQDGQATTQDYVFVYLWYAYTQNSDRLHRVAKQMTPTQITDAQRRVKAWVYRRPPCH